MCTCTRLHSHNEQPSAQSCFLWIIYNRKRSCRKETDVMLKNVCTHTLVSCGELRMCTVLGLTPLALALRYRAKRLFLRPRSPLGREPLYLKGDRQERHRVENKSTGQNSDLSRAPIYLFFTSLVIHTALIIWQQTEVDRWIKFHWL